MSRPDNIPIDEKFVDNIPENVTEVLPLEVKTTPQPVESKVVESPPDKETTTKLTVTGILIKSKSIVLTLSDNTKRFLTRVKNVEPAQTIAEFKLTL